MAEFLEMAGSLPRAAGENGAAGSSCCGTCLDGDNVRRMALSARNQFVGTVISLKTGSVMSEVVIDIGGGNEIVSLISASSAKRLKLKKGGRALAVIKATEVIVSTDLPEERD